MKEEKQKTKKNCFWVFKDGEAEKKSTAAQTERSNSRKNNYFINSSALWRFGVIVVAVVYDLCWGNLLLYELILVDSIK